MRWLFALSLIFGLSATAQASDTAPIGIVKEVIGTATILQGDRKVTPQVGADIFLNDDVSTGADGGIGISLNDSTTLSLGENSRLRIDRFVYEPQANKLGFGMEVMQGTLSYLSGKIGAIAPEQVSVATPSMTIGIRGTTFLLKVKPVQ
tara:strand:+ start:56848 stop:57294 length:447 start_codon:yes stop_codon:yes gene_type:complete